ncbi:ASCH domain-containing protein [Actinomyces procaprae]|uniref:ASCH domain-containing protein n=1 Tax=Actinomyces procaprae TaxID=2560010 RepID=UPI001FF8C368|nr:ASCH domain-containing protein [Actinomyces procaprae]
MSIHPAYARAILEGRKTIEFRKRRLAADITHVVIYSTAPEQAVIGYFTVEGQETSSPASLWGDFHAQGVISEDDFFAYYAGRDQATGIKVGKATRLRSALSLVHDLGVAHPPQSFQYLPHDRFAKVLAAV